MSLPLDQIRLTARQREALEDANGWGLTLVAAGFAHATGPKAAHGHYARAQFSLQPVNRLVTLGLLEREVKPGGKAVWRPSTEGLFLLHRLSVQAGMDAKRKGAR